MLCFQCCFYLIYSSGRHSLIELHASAMVNVACEIVICLLLLTAVRGTSGQPKQIIYVDEANRTLDPSCWMDNKSKSSTLALDGVELQNSTLVVVKLECKYKELQESVADSPHGPPCPTWFFPNSSLNGTCTCGDDVHGAVGCDESTKEASILDCFCMTYSKSTGPVVGACFYNCEHPTLDPLPTDGLYHLLPSNVTELNTYMCERLNRAGQLCGQCKDNYSIPVYSYDMKCVNCSTSPFNWVKYILAAFLPLTVFFVLVVSCRLSATSPKLLAFVFFSQFPSIGANARVILAAAESYHIASSLAKVILALYGIWNLDFFRTLIPHICVNVNTLQALALDYAVACYPLILLVVAYILIEVHTCNRVIRFMCRPFNRCTERFRNRLDVRTSIVDAFATFLLLSYVKLLSVSFDLLIPTQVHNINGSLVGLYLYYDATIEYFGHNHLPYAVLALVVMLVFIIFPLLLLLLYPMRCFQRCLGCCGVRWHALPIFIDAFQGCYKDGTNGTRDCRYFAASFLFARISLFLICSLSQTELFYGAALFVFIPLAMAIAIMQPYKPRFSTYNAVDSVLILLAALWSASCVCISITELKAHKWRKLFASLSYIVGVLPLFYASFITLHWMCSRRQFGQRMIGRARSWVEENRQQMAVAGSEESLPDRLINPEGYEEDLTDPLG